MKFAMVAVIALLGLVQEKPEYRLKGEAVEACECQSVCPCVFTKDASFAECRGNLVFCVSEGSYGKTDLKGLTFALTITKSDHNMVKSMGRWEGVIYISDKASAEQKSAVEAFVKGKWGPAFSKLDVKSVPIETKLEPDHKEVVMGKVATIKITGVKTPEGKVTVIENPPFSLYPRLSCAKADVHTYADGSTWDFSGHNAFYGPFEYSSTDKH